MTIWRSFKSSERETRLQGLKLIGDLNSRDRRFFDFFKDYLFDIRVDGNQSVEIAKMNEIKRIFNEDEKFIESLALKALVSLCRNEALPIMELDKNIKPLIDSMSDDELSEFCRLLSLSTIENTS
uniref:RPOL4c domain-containing protein n=1 Tax=Strongyloides venezuelensis TaxID=75913 RepID=A0A0K0FJX6_STRVS